MPINRATNLRDPLKRLLIWLVNLVDHITPKRNKIVLRGIPDIEDQCLAVLMALARRRYGGEIILLVRAELAEPELLLARYGLGKIRLKLCRTPGLAAIFHFVTARHVFFTHGCYSQGDWGNYRPPAHKTVVNMWHGMPIKTIWRLLPTPLEAPQANLLLATSPLFQKIMIEASGMEPDSVRVLGLPRNDLLHHRSPEAEGAIRELAGEFPWILYLPTYRKSTEGFITEDGVEHDSVLAMSGPEIRALDEWLEKNRRRLIVKAHPMSIHAGLFLERKTTNITVISERWLVEHQLTLYILAGLSSGLITDISSIAVDYLLLGNPVFIYFPDRAEYVEGRGTTFDRLEENLPGGICSNTALLIDEMDACLRGDDRGRDDRDRLLAEWHTHTAGSAAERLLDSTLR